MVRLPVEPPTLGSDSAGVWKRLMILRPDGAEDVGRPIIQTHQGAASPSQSVAGQLRIPVGVRLAREPSGDPFVLSDSAEGDAQPLLCENGARGSQVRQHALERLTARLEAEVEEDS